MNLYSGFHTLTHNRIPSCLIPRRPHRNKYFPFCSSTAFAKTSHSSFERSRLELVIPFTRHWMPSPALGETVKSLHFTLLSEFCLGGGGGNINANFSLNICVVFKICSCSGDFSLYCPQRNAAEEAVNPSLCTSFVCLQLSDGFSSFPAAKLIKVHNFLNLFHVDNCCRCHRVAVIATQREGLHQMLPLQMRFICWKLLWWWNRGRPREGQSAF